MTYRRLMVSMTSPPDAPLGVQQPRVQWVPEYVTSAGQEAIELAASAGLHLDPWQQNVLTGGLGETADGRWSAFEVGLVVARQNGKGAIFEARELAGLFLFGERLIVHSAHLFETSMEHMIRVLQLIESTPELDRRVQRVSRAHGEEGITLKGGQRLKFKTRTKGGGRGLSGDCIVLDEAMELSAAALAALMPTLSARPNPQLWYGGSAVDQMVHANGVVFAKIRERGHAGGDPSLAFFEHSVDPDVYNANPAEVAADPRYWAIANPGKGIRITEEYIGNEQRSLPAREFSTERLGIGDWPDVSEGADQVIPQWASLADPESEIAGTVAFAVDMTPERDWTCIAAAGRTSDGRMHVEITGGDDLDHRPGSRWVVPRILELVESHGPCVLVIDGRSPAASLIPELEAAGVTVAGSDGPDGDALIVKTTAGEMAQACGALFDAATADPAELVHFGQRDLDQALKAAKRRDVSDAWAWARKSGGDISPLVAVTLAAYGHTVHGATRKYDVANNVW